MDIAAIDSHTAGEPTRVIVAGFPPIPGATVLDKMEYFRQHLDHLRRAVLWEPRGHADMVGAVLVPPSAEGATLGAFFMDAGGYLTMCGHGTMGVITVAIEEGLVACPGGGIGVVDTPAGPVPFRASVVAGRVEEVTIRNVPSFLLASDVPLVLERAGRVVIDVAYGGNWFALVDVAQLGVPVAAEHLPFFVETGVEILREANVRVPVRHPAIEAPQTIDLVEFYEDGMREGCAGSRNVVVFGRGQYDRSPCGTGTSARLAMLHARGRLALNEPYVSESIIGSTFRARLVAETPVGPIPAVVPEIAGRAWVTGRNTLVVHQQDPFAEGFLGGPRPG